MGWTRIGVAGWAGPSAVPIYRTKSHTEYQLVHNGPVDIFRHMPNMFQRLSMRMRVEPCHAESKRSHAEYQLRHYAAVDIFAERAERQNTTTKNKRKKKIKDKNKKKDQRTRRKIKEQEEKKTTLTQETQQEQEHSNTTPKPKPKHKKKHDGRLAPGCAETAVNGGFPTKLSILRRFSHRYRPAKRRPAWPSYRNSGMRAT